jgi:hypothetical protein
MSTWINRHNEQGETVNRGEEADQRSTPSQDYTIKGRGLGRRSVVARERELFGGIKIGSAFFGWLTATGTAVLLTALVVAAGAAIGMSANVNPGTAATQATQNPQTVSIVGVTLLLVVAFVAYYCGGYVAGRMARFNGLSQGLAVWLWAVMIAVVVTVVAAVAGSNDDVLSSLNSFQRIPVDIGSLTVGGAVVLVGVALISLAGALLGGLAGMHFHRRVDQARFVD